MSFMLMSLNWSEITMALLRYGEPEGNSSLRSISARARALRSLSVHLRSIAMSKTLPFLDDVEVPIVEDWFVDKLTLPILVGRIHYPGLSDPKASDEFRFTAPIELLSLAGGCALSTTRWYRLGSPLPIANDTLATWSYPNEP